MSKKEQISQEKLSEEIQTLTKLIDQKNAVIGYQLEEIKRLVEEVNKKIKETDDLTKKAKALLEQTEKKKV
jgi:methyl-accepting chemotaxis protein